MALHGSIERLRLDRSRCAGELRMSGVVALRHCRIAFHMSVPSFVVFFYDSLHQFHNCFHSSIGLMMVWAGCYVVDIQ